MANNNSGLAINNEVLAKMTEMATLETEGVVSMSNGPISMPKILGKMGGTRSVTVSTAEGIINIELFVKVRDNWRNSSTALKDLGYKEQYNGLFTNA